jgi:hypothetical protein
MPHEMVASEVPPPLPKKKKGRGPGTTAKSTFAEMIRSIGSEAKDYYGLEIPQREVIVRMMYKAMLEGKIEFPDGRELTLDWEQWSALVWDTIKHLDIVAVNATVSQNGALVGAALTTNVVLYLPQNTREVEGSVKVLYTDRDKASQEIQAAYPSVGREIEQQIVDGLSRDRIGGHPSGEVPNRIV